MAMQGHALGCLFFADCVGSIMPLILVVALPSGQQPSDSWEWEFPRHLILYGSFLGILVIGVLMVITIDKRCQLDID